MSQASKTTIYFTEKLRVDFYNERSSSVVSGGYCAFRFNNMRTLKFKTQPTNAFFATVYKMFGGSSQLPTTAERAVTLAIVEHSSDNIVGSWEEPPDI